MTGPVGIAPARGVSLRGAGIWYAYLALGYFTYLVSIQGNILPFLKSELELSYSAASLHTSVIATGLIVLGLLGERFHRRFGRRLSLQAGLWGSAVAVLLLCVSPAAWASIASCALFGLLGGLVPMTVNAALSDVPGLRREVAFTEANAVAYAFAVMAPALTGAVVWLGLGWRFAIVIGAAAGVAIAMWFVRAPVRDTERREAIGGGRLPLAFWLHSAALGFAVALEFSVLLWAPSYLGQVVGLSPTFAATAASAFFVAMLVGRVGGAWLVHRVDGRHLLFGAFVTTIVGFAGYWVPNEPAIVIAGLFVVGLGVSLTFPVLMAFGIGAAGAAAERAAPRLMLAPALAILASPVLFGALADEYGLRLAQLVTPAVAVLMLAGFLGGEARRHPS